MENAHVLLLDALRCAIHGEAVTWSQPPEPDELRRLIRLAREQNVLPLVIQAICSVPVLSRLPVGASALRMARMFTLHQAARTAEVLLLLEQLEERGLRPAVVKGMACRALYPEPEQRPSSDEDLLIPPEDYPRYREALLACGLSLRDPDVPAEEGYEVTFVDPERDLYLELHLRLFADEVPAYGDCGALFRDCLSRVTQLRVSGRTVSVLEPTDHLLYLLCHAFKHMLHGGVGVRQLCDICLLAGSCSASIDWDRARRSCEELGILTLAAAIFRVGERYLDLPMPAAFADPDVDELPLLQDCLTGGVFGAEDPDRLHSSTLTLDAVAAAKQGRARRGLLPALFPSARNIAHRFPYLRKRPWLLPVAWIRRAWLYAAEKKAGPAASLRIARERIDLLKLYDLIS